MLRVIKWVKMFLLYLILLNVCFWIFDFAHDERKEVETEASKIENEAFFTDEVETPTVEPEIQMSVKLEPLNGVETISGTGEEAKEETEGTEVQEMRRVFANCPLEMQVQLDISDICTNYGIDASLVMAMIKVESNFNPDAIGDNGKSFGLMQIQKKWHTERMEDLNVDNLLDPVDNVLVGVDYLREMLDLYDDMDMAIIAYNMGEGGADNLFDQGIYETKYLRKVKEAMQLFR